MELSPEQLKQLEELAGNFFTPAEIALIMELDGDLSECILDSNCLIAKAYNRGRLLTEAKVRESIFKLAKEGSAPAQTLAMQIIDKARL